MIVARRSDMRKWVHLNDVIRKNEKKTNFLYKTLK